MYEFFDFDYKNAVFEWDDNKADINFKNHGIRFETAVKIFADDNKLIRYDEEHPQEERYNILGKIGNVLFVVCTFKQDNLVRIISARLATKSEKERYLYGEDFNV